MIIASTLLIGGCCLGNRKCNQEDLNERYRVLNTSGMDLVFGPGKRFDKNTIRFFSLNGTDTVFHHYGPGPNPDPGGDSLLFVSYDYRKYETVFVKLDPTDTDTISIRYEAVDGSPCCPDYTAAVTARYNSVVPVTGFGGITVLKK